MKGSVENKEICSKCGGRCCKNNPGIYAGGQVKDYKDRIGKDLGIVLDIVMNPEVMPTLMPWINDMPKEIYEITKAEFKLMDDAGLVDLSNGRVSTFILALRPLGVRDEFGVVNTKYITLDAQRGGNKCRSLTPEGCSMKLKDRPYQCASLEPNETFVCGGEETHGYLGVELAESWIPYQEELRECLKDYLVTLTPEQVTRLCNEFDDLFNAMIEESFLGINIDRDGRIVFVEE